MLHLSNRNQVLCPTVTLILPRKEKGLPSSARQIVRLAPQNDSSGQWLGIGTHISPLYC